MPEKQRPRQAVVGTVAEFPSVTCAKELRVSVVPHTKAGMLVSDHPFTDGTTVRAAQTGDPDAFAALFHEYHPTIYAYAYRLCLCASDAQDVAQETFIKAARALPDYRPEAPFRNWLYHICTNTARDWQRRRGRRQTLDEALNAESEINREERPRDTDMVREALAVLSHDLRATISLVYLEGMTHAQAAKILGCAETTVSWRIFTAKRKLKTLLHHG